MEEKVQEGNESALPKLNEMVERLEKANAEAKEILKRQEELLARNILGGYVVSPKMVEAVEESPKDYAKRILSGKR